MRGSREELEEWYKLVDEVLSREDEVIYQVGQAASKGWLDEEESERAIRDYHRVFLGQDVAEA
jgi:hypothetical protein